MIILDTDCLSLLQRESILTGSKLHENLDRFAADDIFTTIISFEEQMRGWLAFVAKSRTADQDVYAYGRLHAALNDFRNANVLDFDERASLVCRELRSQRIRIGTMDLKIASIAIANEAILISRNLHDFDQVPGLTVQDWTI
ncbi:MAG: type II toxin-antitoxin system VapC family toxin [Acidobacteria bacterium]|nr:type II toxin-antitoxin system VapC family toxin [Acidobacteriota bacterium]